MAHTSHFLLASLALFLASISEGLNSASGTTSGNAANPIRKVVTMLQMMEKKVNAEGKREEALYEKFMCYCKGGTGALDASIAAAEAKIPQLGSSIKEAIASQSQLAEDVKAAQAARSEAKATIATATGLRGKEAAAYAAGKSEYEKNIAALEGAIGAVEKGMTGSFLQTNTAATVRKLAISGELSDMDRQDLMAFLSGEANEGYTPQSGQITGILKQLNDEMKKGLAESTTLEKGAIASFDSLMSSKTQEVNLLTTAIETKSKRLAELGVEIASMKNDLEDTDEALAEDKKFIADLKTKCATETAKWEEICKTRNEELKALADTIKVLNDDEALDLFKKTLPGASLLQLQAGASTARNRALAALRAARGANFNVDFIELALRGKKIGFEKVFKMIDELIAVLKAEQGDDDNKKAYCEKKFDEADDKKKAQQKSIADDEAAIAEAEDTIATLKVEIEALDDGIKALDKSVAEASEQRKEEHADFTALIANDSAAKEILGWAKNRLNKFYNPSQYKAPPKRVLSEEEQITVNMGGTLEPTAAPGGIAGTGIAALAQSKAAPPPPPESLGAYKKKGEESNGVIAMIDLLVKELAKEMQVAEVDEKDAQADYEKAMADAAAKRKSDAKLMAEKESFKAETETKLEAHTESKTATTAELMATEEYINSLHGECDFLLKYFDARKSARDGEIDSLNNAKALLSGADFSLLQKQTNQKARRFLHR